MCRLLHFGSPPVKLVVSYCLFELFTRISEQRTSKQEELRCTTNYLSSVIATLEGLVVYGDHRVATNCSLCLSLVLGWQEMNMQERRVIVKNKWCRIIVEELAESISLPCLASNAFAGQEPAIIVAVALLKLQKDFGWMQSIFDQACISRIIENVTASNLSPEMVSLFRGLLNSEFMQADHISSLNSVLQVTFPRTLYWLVHYNLNQKIKRLKKKKLGLHVCYSYVYFSSPTFCVGIINIVIDLLTEITT